MPRSCPYGEGSYPSFLLIAETLCLTKTIHRSPQMKQGLILKWYSRASEALQNPTLQTFPCPHQEWVRAGLRGHESELSLSPVNALWLRRLRCAKRPLHGAAKNWLINSWKPI